MTFIFFLLKKEIYKIRRTLVEKKISDPLSYSVKLLLDSCFYLFKVIKYRVEFFSITQEVLKER